MQQRLTPAHVSCGAGRTQEEAERRAEDADAEREAEEERQQRAQMEYYMSMMAQQNAAREDRSGARSLRLYAGGASQTRGNIARGVRRRAPSHACRTFSHRRSISPLSLPARKPRCLPAGPVHPRGFPRGFSAGG